MQTLPIQCGHFSIKRAPVTRVLCLLCGSLCQRLRAIPAAQSEVHALYGLDPFTLAQLAAKDAGRAVALQPRWPTAHLQQVRGFRVDAGFQCSCCTSDEDM